MNKTHTGREIKSNWLARIDKQIRRDQAPACRKEFLTFHFVNIFITEYSWASCLMRGPLIIQGGPSSGSPAVVAFRANGRVADTRKGHLVRPITGRIHPVTTIYGNFCRRSGLGRGLARFSDQNDDAMCLIGESMVQNQCRTYVNTGKRLCYQ